MGTYLAIFLLWLAPGLGVFLYLLWISKRRRPAAGNADASATPVPTQPQAAEEQAPARKEVAKGG